MKSFKEIATGYTILAHQQIPGVDTIILVNDVRTPFLSGDWIIGGGVDENNNIIPEKVLTDSQFSQQFVEVPKRATDYEKFLALLNEWGVGYDLETTDEGDLYIALIKKPQEHNSFRIDANFDNNGKFMNFESWEAS